MINDTFVETTVNFIRNKIQESTHNSTSVSDQFNSIDFQEFNLKSFISASIYFFEIEEITLTMALIYISRFTNKNCLNLNNVYFTFLVSLHLADNFVEDYKNISSGFPSLMNLNTLEFYYLQGRFLDTIDWSLFVSDTEYLNFRLSLV